jgi:hypothetical protein
MAALGIEPGTPGSVALMTNNEQEFISLYIVKDGDVLLGNRFYFLHTFGIHMPVENSNMWWHVDPLLSNTREISNYTTAVAK